jgi:uncharacterized protein
VTYMRGRMLRDAVDPPARPCPICGKPATRRHRPFCSARCAFVDLHRWLGDGYRFATDEAAEDRGAERDER